VVAMGVDSPSSGLPKQSTKLNHSET
jgi:hypothetical protein